MLVHFDWRCSWWNVCLKMTCSLTSIVTGSVSTLVYSGKDFYPHCHMQSTSHPPCEVSLLLCLSPLSLLEKLRLKIQNQSRKLQLAPCAWNNVFTRVDWMNEDAGMVKGQLGGPAQRSVLESLFFTGRVSSLEKALWKHLSYKTVTPLRASSSCHPSTQHPRQVLEQSQENTWSQLSKTYFHPVAQDTSFSPGCPQKCQIMDYCTCN